MSSDNERHLGIVDDPTPPEPDAARLGRVIARGRQRRIRRRAMLGALAGSVALVLVGGGVAVAEHKAAGPHVEVRTPPAEVPETSANVREVDAAGLHYTLTLTTPTVSEGGMVRVSLRVENRTAVKSTRSACTFGIEAVDPRVHSLGMLAANCGRPRIAVDPGATFDESAQTTAPARPGVYSVNVNPESVDEFPAALLQDPFELEVLPNRGPTATTTQPGSSSEIVGPTQTAPPGNTTTYNPLSANPQAGDFTGTLTARKTATTVGHGVELSLTIRNTTDHMLEGARGSLPNSVAIVCARDLSSDGSTSQPLNSDENLFFVDAPLLAPGDSGARSANFVPTADDIGTVTCAGVILATSAQWQDGTLSSIARLTNVPPVTFTVAESKVSAATTVPVPQP